LFALSQNTIATLSSIIKFRKAKQPFSLQVYKKSLEETLKEIRNNLVKEEGLNWAISDSRKSKQTGKYLQFQKFVFKLIKSYFTETVCKIKRFVWWFSTTLRW